MAEHFNAQLEPEPGLSPFGPSEYNEGPNVVRQLRDERLGGPEQGEHLLRDWYFGGNPKPLQEQMERTSGGPRGFFEEYRTRLDAPPKETPRADAARVDQTEDWR